MSRSVYRLATIGACASTVGRANRMRAMQRAWSLRLAGASTWWPTSWARISTAKSSSLESTTRGMLMTTA